LFTADSIVSLAVPIAGGLKGYITYIVILSSKYKDKPAIPV
jgi:hypothetical protein